MTTKTATPVSDAGSQYRFQHLRTGLILGDMRFGSDDPKPGDAVPEFDLPTVDGGRFQSGDLSQNGPALLVFGSLSCPVTDDSAPGFRELHAKYGNDVWFVFVNVREGHPGQALPQPQSADEKMKHAKLLREFYGFDFEVAVDDADGSLHRALSPKPNSAYLLGQDGTILYRAHWANDTNWIGQALAAVIAGDPLRKTEGWGMMRAMMPVMAHIGPTLDRAGGGAWCDLWVAMPPLAMMARVMKLMRLRASGAK
ncbi:MAG TPA: alkyl hydroperoxide reductase [Dehalococcoidia bacterium]|nr:alkyl hydroperoxide reductase [Dehalococcoidia bacterium]